MASVMTIGVRKGRIFLSHPHKNNGFFFLLTTKYLILYWKDMKRLPDHLRFIVLNQNEESNNVEGIRLLKPADHFQYSKTCVKQPLSKRPQIGFQDQLSLNAGQKYSRMLQGEHSAILSTFIK